MVSFTCNHCQDVVKKPKVHHHANACGSHTFTCVDCMHVFDLDTIKGHTSCVTEEDKYQGKWKQKLNSNGSTNAKSTGEAPRGIERPPRAPMNDLSSAEDSDDDWVRKPAAKKAHASAKAPTAATAAASSRKHPRPGVSPSSDDEGEAPHATLPAAKKAKTTSAAGVRSASATPKTRPAAAVAAAVSPRSPPSSSLGPKLSKPPKKAATPAPHHHGMETEEVQHPGKKDTPLLLPRSATSTECIVPSFVLGTSDEVADIVKDVLRESGVEGMRSKDVAKELVRRYEKRIAKSVRHAVDAAVELGALKLDKKDNVCAL